MDKPKFSYNKLDASCHFCGQTENPHPDFDEPIVTTRLKSNTQEIEVCINCWHELDTLTKSENKAFSEVVKERENIFAYLIDQEQERLSDPHI